MCDNTHYLYGAAVQGIQDFIFQTNELKDIVGASELVENICTTAFRDLLGTSFKEESKVVMAAGNIKYIFDHEEDCRMAVLHFPKKVMEMAPGITISQAVVKYGTDFNAAVQQLESKLRIQRNRPTRSMTLGAIGILRSRKTGLPAVAVRQDEHIDLPTLKKREIAKENNVTFKLSEKFFGAGNVKYRNIAYDIKDLTDRNNWIAIIHADGNGLGQVVQQVGRERDTFKQFSDNLDKATSFAANRAFRRLGITDCDYEVMPLRPIVLSGDDLTVICRADVALDFAHYFMDEFEYATGRGEEKQDHAEIADTRKILKGILKGNKIFKDGSTYLSACAGIAYTKSSYPFHYGYELAETLCGVAKKEAKTISGGMENLPPSCLMFHKVQSSFVEDYRQIKEKELTASGVDLSFGPYYLGEQRMGALGCERWTIDMLRTKMRLLADDSREGRAVKNHLRECCNLLFYDKGLVEQKMVRLLSMVNDTELNGLVKKVMQQIFPGKEAAATAGKDGARRSALYDLLSLYSIQNIITR